jgi:predicted dehydrogenase
MTISDLRSEIFLKVRAIEDYGGEMSKDHTQLTRREFVANSAKGVAGAAAVTVLRKTTLASPVAKKRVALVGTGIRGTTMWGQQLLEGNGDRVEMVGLCDINSKRVEASRKLIGIKAPTFTSLERMLQEVKPEALIVTTKDGTHHEQIIHALRSGCDVITEKPMTTTEAKCQMILDAEKNSGKKITVAFNYRFSARAEKVKELLMSNVIGPITSVDFHWYLDTTHGADYFRRWHAYKANSGSLFVHKATHHFDLVNWYLDAEPVEVRAQAALRNYGRNGKIRGRNCRDCTHKKECSFYWDINQNPVLTSLYVNCESEDGYLRDACVYREDIDIYDTMTAEVKYTNGALLSYSLNAFMPYEGHSISFNGINGRLDVRSYEKQPWPVQNDEEIRLSRNFGKSEMIPIQQTEGGHGGADPRLLHMAFHPEQPDPLKQRAGSRAGAMSILTGIAAVRSVETGQPIKIADLVKFS